MRNEVAIRDAVGPLDFAVDPAPDHAERVQTLPLSFYDGLVASQITQPYVLVDLVGVLGLPEIDVLRALLALRCVGVLAPFVPGKVLSDTGRLRSDSGRLRLDTGRLRIDSGRLRADSGLLRPLEPVEEAQEETQAVALALDMISNPREPAAPPSAAPRVEEVSSPRTTSVAKPPPPPPRKRRGNTAQLNLLSSAYRQMAEAELQAGNIAGAVRFYEAALAQCPENVDLVIALAGVLAGRPGGAALAEELLRKACVEHPNSASPRIALAKSLKSSGRHIQANELLEEARRLDPDNAEVKELTAVRQGGIFSRLRAAAQDFAGGRPSDLSSGGDAESTWSKKCRYCGAMCKARAVACIRCGATL
jgi:hypothetical protein